MRTSVRCAIIIVIAHLSPAEITPSSRHRRPAHDYRHRPPDRPPLARRYAGPPPRRPGRGRRLESVLSDNTRRVYGAQWRLFNDWCDSVVLRSMPAEPLTVARYLAVRAGDGASIATLRLATSAIAKVHEWAGHDSPGRDRGVREALKGWGRRLARLQRQAGALTADVLAVIRLTAPKPRARGRGFETAEQAAQRARFDLALVAVLSDGGLRRSEAAALTWGDAQRWDDGSGRITVIRSKTDALPQGWPWQNQFSSALARLRALPLPS